MRFKVSFLMLLALLFFHFYFTSNAAPPSVYTSPTNVTVEMYELNAFGASTGDLCIPTSTKWGCTAFCDNFGVCASGPTKPYPYSSSTPTLPIENDYLLDVVAQEVPVNDFHPVAVEAQAIAARSYTYGHIKAGSTIDNSTNKHAFIPYRFESLNPTATPNNTTVPCDSTNLNSTQQKLCTGTEHRYYISYGAVPNDDDPAITQYFADIPNATIAGGQSHEISVADPVSSHPDVVQDGHGVGMSQKRASRWGYGNLGYKGNLDPWSVQWTKAAAILMHYYTGVHLRDANNNNAKLTPEYRWNPLAIDWGSGATEPPDMQVGTTCNVNIQLQNTGAVNWGSDVRLSCQWKKPDGSIVNCDTEANPGTLTMGSPAPTVTLPVRINSGSPNGIYTLMIDMKQGSTSFHNREAGKVWPTLNYKVCAGGNCSEIILPIVLKNSIGVPCQDYTETWYPTGTNTCSPYVSNCNEGDGQPDGVYAGPWSTGSHRVEFPPQLVLNQTYVGTYWKTHTGVYGHLYIDAKLDGQWSRVRTSLYQSTSGRWEQQQIGQQHAGKYITGLRFGFSTSTAGHKFKVDGYRIRNFMRCAN